MPPFIVACTDNFKSNLCCWESHSRNLKRMAQTSVLPLNPIPENLSQAQNALLNGPLNFKLLLFNSAKCSCTLFLLSWSIRFIPTNNLTSIAFLSPVSVMICKLYLEESESFHQSTNFILQGKHYGCLSTFRNRFTFAISLIPFLFLILPRAWSV